MLYVGRSYLLQTVLKTILGFSRNGCERLDEMNKLNFYVHKMNNFCRILQEFTLKFDILFCFAIRKQYFVGDKDYLSTRHDCDKMV